MLTKVFLSASFQGIFFSYFLIFTPALAQEVTTRDYPGGLPVQSIPEFIRWEVVTSEILSMGDSQKSRVVMRNETTRTGQMAQEIMTDAAGVKTEKWQVGPVFYLKLPGQNFWGEYTPEYLRNSTNDDSMFQPIPMERFRGLEWISQDTFVDVLTDAGRDFLIFVPKPFSSVSIEGPNAFAALPKFAKIDAKTRFPDVVRDGKMMQKFTFSEIPKTLLSLPEDLVREIKEGQEKRRSLFSAPGKEY